MKFKIGKIIHKPEYYFCYRLCVESRRLNGNVIEINYFNINCNFPDEVKLIIITLQDVINKPLLSRKDIIETLKNVIIKDSIFTEQFELSEISILDFCEKSGLLSKNSQDLKLNRRPVKISLTYFDDNCDEFEIIISE